MNAANQDTVSWNSSAHPLPSSYSTLDHHPSWTEVVVRGRKRDPVRASPPRLSLSNHYAALPGDTPAPPVDAPTLQPQVANSAGETCNTDVDPTLRSEPRTETSASRRRIVKEAVLRRSGKHPPSAVAVTQRPGPDAAGSPPHSSARSRSVDPTPCRVETGELLHSPHPLVSPTTLIVGDSITRNICFFNATTRCFPGAKVSTILDKLPELINSLPSSIHRVIVHTGYNDMSVFISGPLPTMTQRPERFSRLLNLNIWLQSTCKIHNFTFIDNFNLFWNRTSLYSTDGIHPNTLGSSVLAANIQHAVQSAPHNGPHS
uniref:SGNH hydrolase-type esterase domain-containing protein n=1 Tax=Gadus morhua TaxID=8049 RepID=A0A8C5CP56_GADMO